jgi:hypothetical protein
MKILQWARDNTVSNLIERSLAGGLCGLALSARRVVPAKIPGLLWQRCEAGLGGSRIFAQRLPIKGRVLCSSVVLV